MALDPESQRLIELMVAANRPAWNTLSPQAARDLYLSLRPAAQIFDSLVTFKTGTSIVAPRLATSWSVSKNHLA